MPRLPSALGQSGRITASDFLAAVGGIESGRALIYVAALRRGSTCIGPDASLGSRCAPDAVRQPRDCAHAKALSSWLFLAMAMGESALSHRSSIVGPQ
mmetsp:Transcript_17859/g.58391  ORF Transcript_17859/g.58391 Transcript_17859/m.58391 type:complete len:98 (-) Transcript_17859:825-1118(-)